MLFEPFPVLVPVLMKKRNVLDKPAAGLPGIVNYSNTPIWCDPVTLFFPAGFPHFSQLFVSTQN